MSNRDLYANESNTDEAWETSYDTTSTEGDSSVKDKAKNKMNEASAKKDEVAGKAQNMMEEGKEKASEFASTAQDRADEGMNKTADGLHTAADKVRERGSEHGGAVASAADTAANAMESAENYLRDTNTAEMMDQVEAYIRKNPTQSLLIAAGVGFVLAKAFK